MTLKTFLTTAAILAACFGFWTCKDDTDCSNEAVFCTFVETKNFDATGPLIDGFLATLEEGSSGEKLEKLRQWLACKSCVAKAEILCNSCIYTLPPQSELSIDFVSNGLATTLTLDILMSDPLQFLRFHE